MKPPATVRRIVDALARQHPNADTELHYRTAYELLVATMLSAQSTDARVNIVTPALFARYPDARALSRASQAELEPQIVTTGFFRQKARALIGMAQLLVAEHDGEVPAEMAKLTRLPGVGRKTANVVLGHALGVPGLPVDRHVLRVSNRIGLASGDDPETVESQLCTALPKAIWTLASDVQILHGRRICKPKPLCDRCAVRRDCEYFQAQGPAVAGPQKRKPALAGPRKGKPVAAGPRAKKPATAGPHTKAPAARRGRRSEHDS